MTSQSSNNVQPLPMIVALFLVAAALLAGGFVLGMAISANGYQLLGVVTLFAFLAGFAFVQKRALIAAHDRADARPKRTGHHRRPRGHNSSRLQSLVVPASVPTVVLPRIPAHQTGPISASTSAARRGCDSDTAVIPAVRVAGVR